MIKIRIGINLFCPSSGNINNVSVQLLKLNNNKKILYENNMMYIDTTGYYSGKGDS